MPAPELVLFTFSLDGITYTAPDARIEVCIIPYLCYEYRYDYDQDRDQKFCFSRLLMSELKIKGY